MNRQQGFTLVELLIASLLGLLLSASILSALYASMQSNKFKIATEEVQENAALAMHFLKQDIKSIGFSGCFSQGFAKINISSTGSVAELLNAYGVIAANQYQFKQSDSLSFIANIGTSEDLINDMANVHSSIDLTANSEILATQEVLITDCINADLLSVTAVWNNRLSHDSKANLDGNLSHAYQRGASVYRLYVIEYKIARGASGVPGLYRKFGKARFQELIPNVVKMNLSYASKNTKTGLITYQPTVDSLGDQQLISVDVELLLVSQNEVMPSSMVLKNNNGQLYQASDKRFYKDYRFSVALANNE